MGHDYTLEDFSPGRRGDETPEDKANKIADAVNIQGSENDRGTSDLDLTLDDISVYKPGTIHEYTTD